MVNATLITHQMVPVHQNLLTKTSVPHERVRTAPMPTCARDLGWKRLDVIVTTDSPKNKESSSTDTPNLHTPHLDRLVATVRYYYRVRCPGAARRTEWRTAAGPFNGAGLCLFRQSVTPRFVIAVIMRPRVIVDSMVIGEKEETEER